MSPLFVIFLYCLQNLYWHNDKVSSLKILFVATVPYLLFYYHYLLRPLLMVSRKIYDIFQNITFTTHSTLKLTTLQYQCPIIHTSVVYNSFILTPKQTVLFMQRVIKSFIQKVLIQKFNSWYYNKNSGDIFFTSTFSQIHLFVFRTYVYKIMNYKELIALTTVRVDFAMSVFVKVYPLRIEFPTGFEKHVRPLVPPVICSSLLVQAVRVSYSSALPNYKLMKTVVQ